ncbi:hypothetical protein [uncultured Sphingomonas sp.]|uniref:hypothetical protein n=1 Tax=uncultured Sphingomonas sp. TaxID=158754 RepID=UPI0025EF5927|nr:hypothetical protein [uncultured Sphingomonas sp.]
MATALKDAGVLSILLCFDLLCLSIAVGDLGITANTETCLMCEGSGAIGIIGMADCAKTRRLIP